MGFISFRKATSGDFPNLARLISTDKAWTCYGINYDAALGIFREMEDSIFIAERDGEFAGFATLRINGFVNIGAYVRMIAVVESLRGSGVGKQLIDYVSNSAFVQSSNVFLICSIDNRRAQTFYERLGFEQVGILSDLVVEGHDEILYRRTAGSLRSGADIT